MQSLPHPLLFFSLVSSPSFPLHYFKLNIAEHAAVALFHRRLRSLRCLHSFRPLLRRGQVTGALAARNSSPSPPFYSFPPPLCLSVLLLTLRRRARCFRPAFPAPLLSALAAAPWLGNACCVLMFLHKKCCAMCVERCGLLVACCGHFAFLFKNKRREIGSAAACCNTQNDACKAVAARC